MFWTKHARFAWAVMVAFNRWCGDLMFEFMLDAPVSNIINSKLRVPANNDSRYYWDGYIFGYWAGL